LNLTSLGTEKLSQSTILIDEAAMDFCVSAGDQQAFAQLSGDHNPLHLDPEFARNRGFEGAVVFGAMIVAKISHIIGMQLPGPDGIWSSLKIDFRSALLVGETAKLTVSIVHRSDATRSLMLKIHVACGAKTIATGMALATYHNETPA
jgi:3-hydroxybutyryl-CoA dehydratase